MLEVVGHCVCRGSVVSGLLVRLAVECRSVLSS